VGGARPLLGAGKARTRGQHKSPAKTPFRLSLTRLKQTPSELHLVLTDMRFVNDGTSSSEMRVAGPFCFGGKPVMQAPMSGRSPDGISGQDVISCRDASRAPHWQNAPCGSPLLSEELGGGVKYGAPGLKDGLASVRGLKDGRAYTARCLKDGVGPTVPDGVGQARCLKDGVAQAVLPGSVGTLSLKASCLDLALAVWHLIIFIWLSLWFPVTRLVSGKSQGDLDETKPRISMTDPAYLAMSAKEQQAKLRTFIPVKPRWDFASPAARGSECVHPHAEKDSIFTSVTSGNFVASATEMNHASTQPAHSGAMPAQVADANTRSSSAAINSVVCLAKGPAKTQQIVTIEIK